MSTQLSQIAKIGQTAIARCDFTSLAHLLTPEFLTETWGMARGQWHRRGEHRAV